MFVMKEHLKVAKKEMKDNVRPYQVYGYYLGIPIIVIAVFILSFLGIDLNSVGVIIFVFTILAHIGVRKLTLVSKRKYVAPIIMYVAEAIGFLIGILMISEIYSGGTGDVSLGLMGLIVFPLEIVAIIFFFLTANDIKKAYPTMKEDSTKAREDYLTIKRNS